MMELVAMAALRFAPLGLLAVFSLILIIVLKEDMHIKKDSGKAIPVYYLVKEENSPEGKDWAGKGWLLSEKTTIGRENYNDVVIEDPYVSGRHAQIRQLGKELWLEDLNSTNGTYLNGAKVTEKLQIRPGDVLSIGRILLGVERGEEHQDHSFNSRRVSKAAK